MDMQDLLIIGCDATVDEATDIATSGMQARYKNVRGIQLHAEDYFPRDYSLLDEFNAQETLVCVVGNEYYINQVRAEVYATVKAKGFRFTNIISSQALVSPSANLGESNVIWPGAYIGARTSIGNGCMIRGGAQIYPDCKLENFVTVEPHCIIRESCTLQNHCTLCAHTYLMRTAHIGASVYINKPGQYHGYLNPNTFISPFFENRIQVVG